MKRKTEFELAVDRICKQGNMKKNDYYWNMDSDGFIHWKRRFCQDDFECIVNNYLIEKGIRI